MSSDRRMLIRRRPARQTGDPDYRRRNEAPPQRTPPKPTFDMDAEVQGLVRSGEVPARIASALGYLLADQTDKVPIMDRRRAEQIVDELRERERRFNEKWSASWYDESCGIWRHPPMAGVLDY